MRRRAASAAVLTVLIAVAASLRLPQLAERPMHCDEAVHALKFRDLLEHGDYRYDPHEYHGPTLNYATWLVTTCRQKQQFSDVTESDLRLVPALFGIALVAATVLLSNPRRPLAMFLAAAFTAVSPAMAFYSRYYIQETLLVFFTLGAVVSTWRLWANLNLDRGDCDLSTPQPSRSVIGGWLLLLGISLGLMHATKETAVLAGAALCVAAATAMPGVFRIARRKWAVSFVIVASSAALVSALLVTCGGQHPRAVVDSWSTYLQYLTRAAGGGSAGEHAFPSYHYLHRLLWWQVGAGVPWTELPIAALAVLGTVGAFLRSHMPPEDRRLARFLVVYTAAVGILYSLIPYKTPWCVLSLAQGILWLSGLGGGLLIGWAKPGVQRAGGWLVIIAVAVFSAHQACRAVFVESADPTNPYVYAHTSRDVPALSAELARIAESGAATVATPIQVVAPDDDYWPLPWYLRRFSQVGWYHTMPRGPAAPILVIHATQEPQLAAYLYQNQRPGETRLYVPVPTDQPGQDWLLRPGVALRAFVQLDLWNLREEIKNSSLD
jgi:uncharacterized protein (TIGR03663 family)